MHGNIPSPPRATFPSTSPPQGMEVFFFEFDSSNSVIRKRLLCFDFEISYVNKAESVLTKRFRTLLAILLSRTQKGSESRIGSEKESFP